jgi:hypothetical protein
MARFLRHTNVIAPLMRLVKGPGVVVHRRVTKYRITWGVSVETEYNIQTLVRWCPTTGELYVAGPNTMLDAAEARQAFAMSRHVLDTIAAYGYTHGEVVMNYHAPVDVRPWHYRINE